MCHRVMFRFELNGFVRYCMVLFCSVVYCIVLYCIIQYCIALCSLVLCCLVRFCIALNCIVFYEKDCVVEIVCIEWSCIVLHYFL